MPGAALLVQAAAASKSHKHFVKEYPSTNLTGRIRG
jgi:hypothetical protein